MTIERPKAAQQQMLEARVRSLQGGDPVRLRAAERHLRDYLAAPNPDYEQERRAVVVGAKKQQERSDLVPMKGA